MALYNSLTNSQPDPGSGIFRLGMQPLKNNKDPFSILRLDPYPVIADGE
jgi:hypothetical protein